MTGHQKYLYGEDPIEINAGRRTVRLTVENTGDRAIQIGSHYHFFEVNSALSFDRQQALGMHLNIPAGTSVRVEPGGTREVELCAYAGTGRLVGFSGLLNGSLVSHPARVEAVRRAIEQGFAGARSGTEQESTAEEATTEEPATAEAPKGKATAGQGADHEVPEKKKKSPHKKKGSR